MRLWHFLPITLSIALFAPRPLHAQRYTFKHYRQAEGLGNLNVMAILEDRDGFIWAATQNGVFRFDGFRFEEVRLPSGPATNTVSAMYADAGGRVWLGLESAVEVFQDGKFQIVTDHGKDLPTHAGSTFASSTDGRVFVVSQGDLFQLQQPNRSAAWTARKLPVDDPSGHSPRLAVNSVLAQEDGSLIVGCGSGICRVDGPHVKPWGPKQGLADSVWNVLFRSANGDLWACSDSNIAVLKKGEASFQARDLPGSIVKNDYVGLAEDPKGRILTFSDSRLLRWQGNSWETFNERQGLAPYTLSALLVDHDGEVWFGSIGHGLDKWLGYGFWEQWTAAEGLQSDEVWAIARDHQRRLWVGNAKGVSFLDPGSTRFVPWRMPLDQRAPTVQSITVSPDGAVWMGASGGHLFRIDPVSRKVTRADVSGRINRIMAEKHGRVWLGTADGLYRVESLGSGPISVALSLKGWINDLAEAPDGQLFARTDSSLFRFDGSAWHEIRLGPALHLGGFWADLDSDKPNSLWTDGASPGLVHVQLDGDRVVSSERYTSSTIGSTETVIVTHDRRGRIWVGSDAGIAFLDGAKWRLLNQDQGLIWNDTDTRAFLADLDGSVWIGTTGGLSHLLDVDRYVQARDLRLTSVSAAFGARALDTGQTTSLAWKNVPLVIQLAVPTFHESSGLTLHYRLRGLEQNFVETRNREIRYPQLDPGAYIFEAFASDAARGQSSAIYRLAFVIHPPWWRSTTAITLYGLLSLGLIALIWRWRTKSLVVRQRELEGMVAQRTEELDQKKAEAESANQAKSEFLARMSHEIRTPLNGVIGMTSILREMQLGQDERECVDTIYHSSDLLLTVLNDILDFSKIEAGKLDLENISFDLAETVQQCSIMFSEPARKKGLCLSVQLNTRRSGQVVGDPIRLRQILLNLLSNAVKFTDRGVVELTVSEEQPSSPEMRKLRFEVRDDGPGMRPETLSRLFVSFSQAETSIGRKYGGTGLGLAISKELVELMGGEIGALSQPGAGSVFWFVVELAASKGQAVTAPHVARHQRQAGAPQAVGEQRWHVLVAEDNAVNIRVMARQLEILGHTAEFVTDGAAAVALAASTKFDVILMDCQMPGMDGLEATKLIRANERGPRIPIIAVSASALKGEQARYLEIGMDDVLPKPFKKEELEGILNRWLGVGESILTN